MTGPPAERAEPPVWAEVALRVLLAPKDRETVSGDLLEEYREVVVPARGVAGARFWYVRQVLSFVTLEGVLRAVLKETREREMVNNPSRTSLLWTLAASLALVTIAGLLVRSNFGPPLGLNILVPVALSLAVAGTVSTRSRADVRTLWRVGLLWGGLLASVLLVRLAFEVLAPVDPVERFLARARADYSEFDYPRRWLPAVAVVAIFIGSGFWTAWRTGRVGRGTLAAMAASATGSLTYIALVALGNTLPLGPQDPLGSAPANLQYFGNIPAGLAPVLLMFSAVFGTIGGMFGRGLGAASSRA